MPNATVTFSSNLTYNDNAGSTITSATTSDVITGTAGTVAHIANAQAVTVGAASAAQAVSLGSIDVTKEYAVRFRNLSWATSSANSNLGAVPCIEIVLQTAVSTYQPLGRMYATETFGPIRMVKQASGYPKLLARVTDSGDNTSGISPINLEVIAGDLGASSV